MIISADATRYSPPERRVIEGINSPIPIVLITRLENYQFNEELLKLDKVVLVNMAEFGWSYNWNRGTPIFGKNFDQFRDLYPGEEWEKFNDWITENSPVLTFQRELGEIDVTDKVVPISYPSYEPPYPIQSIGEFNSRPIELFHYFGRSHEARVWFHSNAYKEDGVTLVDNIYYIQGYLEEGRHKHIWCSLHIPHFARLPLQQLLYFNGMSKLSLSMPGCGKRCFRHSEAPLNSIMVLQDDGIAFPFQWVGGFNCIKYKGNDPIPAIKAALQRDDLYDIYVRGMSNIDKYRLGSFNNYFEMKIKNAL